MKKIIYFLAIVGVVLLIFILKPIDTSLDNSDKIEGLIADIYEGGDKDVVFALHGDDITYYINRGLEKRFKLSELKDKFIDQKATVFYARNWTPLAPFGTSSKHITQLIINDSIVYSEFE